MNNYRQGYMNSQLNNLDEALVHESVIGTIFRDGCMFSNIAIELGKIYLALKDANYQQTFQTSYRTFRKCWKFEG